MCVYIHLHILTYSACMYTPENSICLAHFSLTHTYIRVRRIRHALLPLKPNPLDSQNINPADPKTLDPRTMKPTKPKTLNSQTTNPTKPKW